MKLSIHPDIKGKIPKDEIANHKYGWCNIEAEWTDVFELITEDGYATTAELTNDHRTGANFLSRELLMIDIDSGMSIPELLQDDFYNLFGAGFYTTPSHTDDAHRFRIMFRLQTAIADEHRLRTLNRALLQVFKQADQACKDAVRLFYGTPNCVIKECRTNLLTDETVELLLTVQHESDEQEMHKYASAHSEYKPLADSDKKHLIELLHKTYVGNYPIWRNVGWGMKQGGFTLGDFQHVTTGMMSAKSAQDAAKVWHDGEADGKVTMGSVIHLLKQHHGADVIRPQTVSVGMDAIYKQKKQQTQLLKLGQY